MSDSGLEDGSVMDNSSGEGESDAGEGEGTELAECTERANREDGVVVEETGDEEVKHEDDMVEETKAAAAKEETKTLDNSRVRIYSDTEQFVNTYITISVVIITTNSY